MIEKPAAVVTGPTTDPFKNQRLYNQAGIVVEISSSGDASKPNRMTVYAESAVALDSAVASAGKFAIGGNRSSALTAEPGGGGPKGEAWKIAADALNADSTGKFSGTSFQDGREGGQSTSSTSRLTRLCPTSRAAPPKHGMGFSTSSIHAEAAASEAFALRKGKLPSKGLTIASENPVYIHGNFSTGGDGPPSNSGNPTDPEDGSYNRVPASIMGDSITLLSKNWDDSKSTQYDRAREGCREHNC